jgi:hypothetical protein
MRGDDLVDVRALHDHVQHRLLGGRKSELSQIAVGRRLQHVERTELSELSGEPLVAEVRLRTEVGDRAVVELAAGDGRNRDRVLDDEVTALVGKRPRRPLGDEATAQPGGRIGRETRVLDEHVDLVAARLGGHTARDVGHLRRGDEVHRQSETHRRIACQRGGGPIDDALVERYAELLTVGRQRQLPR